MMRVSEEKEHIAVCQYLDLKQYKYYHPANGGYRTPREAVKLRRMGVKAGVPDLVLPYAKSGFHGLYIELKRTDGKMSDVSPHQRDWLTFLGQQGYCAKICFGFEQAKQEIDQYMVDIN